MRIMSKYSICAGVIASYLLATPAFAVGLTEADFSYLTTLDVQSDGDGDPGIESQGAIKTARSN